MLKRHFGFDIDDTITDSVGAYISLLNEKFNKNIKAEDVKGRLCDMYGVPQSIIDEFFESFGNEIFKKLKPFPKSIETINKLYDDGHQITIITARPLTAYDTTISWLKERGVKYHDIHFDEEKAQLAKQIGIEFFFDDHPKIVEAMKKVGITSVFMEVPKNEKIFTSEGIYRVKNWDELYLLIEKFLQKGGK